MDITASQQALTRYYHEASPAAFEAGLRWYFEAHEQVKVLASEHEVDVNVAAAVVAITSPTVPWVWNIREAGKVLANRHLDPDQYKISGYPVNKHKAHKLVVTGDMSLVRGRKVTAFYNNIARPDTSLAVTLDRWMARGAGLIGWTEQSRGLSKRMYEGLSAIIASIAPALLPHQTQAIIWLSIQEEYNGHNN
jgi:hypothetical protein